MMLSKLCFQRVAIPTLQSHIGKTKTVDSYSIITQGILVEMTAVSDLCLFYLLNHLNCHTYKCYFQTTTERLIYGHAIDKQLKIHVEDLCRYPAFQ